MMRKTGFLASEVIGISNDVSNDVLDDVSNDVFEDAFDIPRDVFEGISDGVPVSIWGRLILACVPVVDRYSAVCVYGCIDVLIKASGALRSAVFGTPKKLGAVYGLCSRKVCHWVSVMYGSVRYFFQVGHKALRNSFVDNPEYDAFGV